jgi:hypothetical protein
MIGFPGNDPMESPEWFRHGRGVPRWYSPKGGTVIDELDDSHTELCVQIGFTACFNAETLTVETLRHFVDAPRIDPFSEDGITQIPITLLATLGFFLVSASRTWDRMISFNSELFRRVINSLSSLPASAVLAERNRLRGPDQPLDPPCQHL